MTDDELKFNALGQQEYIL